MATVSMKTKCSICEEERSTFLCRGCEKDFCFDHLTEHCQLINTQLHHIQNDYNQFKQLIMDIKNNLEQHPLIKQIDQWENESINKIKQAAEQCRKKLINYTDKNINRIQTKLNNPNEQLISNEKKNDFNEIDLKKFKDKLEKLKEELNQQTNISIEQQINLFINQTFITLGKSFKIQSQIIKKKKCFKGKFSFLFFRTTISYSKFKY
jgi:chromosome segregation ATPase